MAININFDHIDKKDMEYYRYLKLLRYNDESIYYLLNLFHERNKVDIPNGESKLDNSPGRVIRKPKNKVNPFFECLPFGIDGDKIIIPEFYKKKLQDDIENPISTETIFNICMCTKNVHFWFLLTFSQKYDLYQCVRNYPKIHLFGHRDRNHTFADLLSDLNRFCFVFDSISIELIRKLNGQTIKTSEMQQMIEQNVRKVVTLNDYIMYINDYMNYEPLIRDSLHKFLPFAYFLISEKLIYKEVKEENFFINGSPMITNIQFREPPR
jgi:hypothetical protein